MIGSRYSAGRLAVASVLAMALTLSTAPPLIAASPQAAGAPKLRIEILEGEGAINNIRQRTARDPVVKVVDENDRPVGGAVVTFTMPLRGASGTFANGARSVTILTNPQGVATATGVTPNSVAGEFAINVSASHQGQTASTTIAQTNAAVAGASSAATIGIVAAIAAGAAVAVAVGLSGGDNGGGPGPIITPPPTPQPPSATVTIGSPSAGPGR